MPVEIIDDTFLNPGWTHHSLTGSRLRDNSSYGLKQEELLLQLLERSDRLIVCYSREMDVANKIDCVVLHRRRPALPAVGVQITTRRSVEKQVATLDAVARSGIVSRLLYLEVECSLDQATTKVVAALVRFTASQLEDAAAVFARISRAENGNVVPRVIAQCTLRAGSHPF
jgi:hypothetical protein